MKYRNKKTGVVIKTFGKVSGGDWEPIEEQNPGQESENADSFEDQVEDEAPEEETPVEEAPAEEAPAEKPKTTRRGKK